VGFAIVLLSLDDNSSSKQNPDSKLFRGRQNVIFELEFFIGKLGRDRVISLYRQVDNFEFASYYPGALFIPFDENNHWRYDVIKELKASGHDLDANKLLEQFNGGLTAATLFERVGNEIRDVCGMDLSLIQVIDRLGGLSLFKEEPLLE